MSVSNIPEIFGCMVFNDSAMKERLPEETYKALRKTIDDGRALDSAIADIIATAMKDWAIEKGATHFTHWFQPMTGMTAEKHDSFIYPTKDGGVIMEFSGKELIKGEPDASSFPSGGLRATFEARGYTAWDPSSYAFIKDDTLCIPTAFCSFGGEALDKKTPLLRSMEAVNKQATRMLKLFGTDVKRVTPNLGAEQEYFLIDKSLYDQRRDLVFTGRTLFGARPPKGQELDDHYFGTIKDRVKRFMRDLDEEMWRLGVVAKTEHNEAAPSQHELAPVFTTANIATDQNQLMMETMKKVAARHDLACLLHEKPFMGVSGSGKHNNWGLNTDTGVNLLKPGKSPRDNIQFLVFLTAVIKAVDDHQDLLRISVATAGNDHRLGASEAPPAIVSIFLGDELYEILEAVENDALYNERDRVDFESGVNILPHFKKDTTDRNRTSPFAFTGNKFEFRMPGSADSVAEPNIAINTAVADALCHMSDSIEAKMTAGTDFENAVLEMLRETIKAHKRIIFNGNNYAQEWIDEAEKRGLLNLASTPEAIKLLNSENNVALFEKFGVFSRAEINSRLEIMYENYRKTMKIEGYTMLDMVKRDIMPCALKYTRILSETVAAKRAVIPESPCNAEIKMIKKLSEATENMSECCDELLCELVEAGKLESKAEKAMYYRTKVFPAMQKLRACADSAEPLLPSDVLTYPTYSKLLFSLN